MATVCDIAFLVPLLFSCLLTPPAPIVGADPVSAHTTAPRTPFLPQPYLLKKLEEIGDVMKHANLKYGEYVEEEDSLDIRVVSATSDELTRNTNASSCVLQVFGGLHAFVEDSVLALHDHAGYAVLEFVATLPDIDGFVTAQSTCMDDETFVLLLFEDHLQLHVSPSGGDWTTLVHVQSFTNERLRPTAAEFVHCSSRMYLAVAYADSYGGTVNSLIYEWTGSHLDEIHELPSAGAVDLAVILQQDYFYVILAERPPRPDKHVVTIYKVAPEAPPRRHRLRVTAPRRLLPYEDFHAQEQVFLLVLDTAGKGTVYQLDDDEFKYHHMLDLGVVPAAATVGYLEAVPVLVTAHGSEVTISQLTRAGRAAAVTLGGEGAAGGLLELVEVAYGSYRVVSTTSTASRLLVSIANLAVRRNIVVRPPPVDPLEECLQRVTRELNTRQEIIDDLNVKLHARDVPVEDASVEELSLEHDVHVTGSKFLRLRVETATELVMDADEMSAAAQTLETGVRELEDELEQFVFKDKPIVINFPVLIDGDLRVNKLEAQSIESNFVNGVKFDREHFILDDESLDIGEEYEETNVIDELHVVNLTAPNIFISGFVANPVAKNLVSNNILVPLHQKINDIYLDEIVLRNDDQVIKGKKVFQNIYSKTVAVEKIGEVDFGEAILNGPQAYRLTTTGDIVVDELTVEEVNGININRFMDDVFLKDIHTIFEGNLSCYESLVIEDLQTRMFQNMPAVEILTKSTEQIVTADASIESLQFEVGNFGLINGVNFSRDVAITTKHNIIRTPVSIGTVDIQNDLILNCGEEQYYCGLIDDNRDQRLQVYEAEVVIEGSLVVDNIGFSAGAEVRVGDKDFHTDFEQVFWMKSKEQRIPDGVTFAAGLTVPDIRAERLNGVPVSEYATLHTDFTGATLQIDELHIAGDFVVAAGTTCAALPELGRDVVTTYGDYTITGRKVFADAVEVKHINVKYINEVDINDIVLLDDPRDKTFMGGVTVESVQIKGDLRAECDIEARLVNEFPLKRVSERALRVDRDSYLEAVTFTKSLEGTTILIENGPLADGLKKIDELFIGINVTIDGELKLLNGVNQVKYLNGIDFEAYVGQVVDRNVGGLIAGKKVFTKGLNVATQFEAKTVNGIDFDDIIGKAVRKHGTQKITGTHKIKKLYTEELFARYLNDISTDNFVDASGPIVINSSLILENVNVYGDLNAKTAIDLKSFKASMNNLEARCWEEVNIDGGIDWINSGPITDILDNTVHGFHQNIVSGSVTFQAPVKVNSLSSDVYIDDVDIQFIANDAVLRSEPEQEITGKKTFVGPTNIGKLYVEQGFFSNSISEFDFEKINKTMARKDEENYFEGHIVLVGNVTADNVEATNIHGIPNLQKIVATDRTVSIKNAEVSKITVTGNIYVNNINGANFDSFLQSIVLIEGDTQYIEGKVEFEHLTIGELRADAINDVPVDDFVFDEPEKDIVVEGDVEFKADVNVQGNVMVDYVRTAEDVTNVQDKWDSRASLVTKDKLSNNQTDLKRNIYRAIKHIDKEIDKYISIQNKLDEKLAISKKAYQETYPEFLYLELVRYIDLRLRTFEHSTARCNATSCTVVFSETNLDCLQRGAHCACFEERAININTDNWHWSSSNKSTQERIFSSKKNDYITIKSKINVIDNKNHVYCGINHIMEWNVPDQFNNTVWPIDLFDGNGDTRIVDIQSESGNNNMTLMIVGIRNDEQTQAHSIVMVVEPAKRSVVFSARVATCAVRQVAATVADDEFHVLFANSEACDQVAAVAYKYSADTNQHGLMNKLTPIGSDVVVSDHLAAAVSADGTRTVVVAAVAEGATELVEMTYDSTQSRYSTTQRITRGSYRVVGLAIVHIHGLKNYDTVLCAATSDGSIAVYKKSHPEGWTLRSSGHVDSPTGLLHLEGVSWPYLLVTSPNSTAVLSLTSSGI